MLKLEMDFAGVQRAYEGNGGITAVTLESGVAFDGGSNLRRWHCSQKRSNCTGAVESPLPTWVAESWALIPTTDREETVGIV